MNNVLLSLLDAADEFAIARAKTAIGYLTVRDNKFAELILKECIALQFKKNINEATNVARSEYAKDISTHFGIY